MAKADKSATDKKKAEARSHLKLCQQGKPYREGLKKQDLDPRGSGDRQTQDFARVPADCRAEP